MTNKLWNPPKRCTSLPSSLPPSNYLYTFIGRILNLYLHPLAEDNVSTVSNSTGVYACMVCGHLQTHRDRQTDTQTDDDDTYPSINMKNVHTYLSTNKKKQNNNNRNVARSAFNGNGIQLCCFAGHTIKTCDQPHYHHMTELFQFQLLLYLLLNINALLVCKICIRVYVQAEYFCTLNVHTLNWKLPDKQTAHKQLLLSKTSRWLVS